MRIYEARRNTREIPPPLPTSESFPRHSIRSVYRDESVQSRDESLRFLLNFTGESRWTTTTTTSRWIRTTVPRLFSSRFSKESDPRYTKLSLSFSIYIYIDSVLSRIGETHFAQPFKYLPRIRVALEGGSSDWQSIIEIFSHRVSFDRRWRSFDHCYPLLYLYCVVFWFQDILDCYFEMKYSNIWYEERLKGKRGCKFIPFLACISMYNNTSPW